MLISHARRFIYLKTRKTGGTSVEIYFEPWCRDPAAAAQIEHYQEAAVSSWGIVGSRNQTDHASWYNHAPAAELKQRLGDVIWRAYFKFCVVRNPFDKTVSSFWFHLHPSVRALLTQADFSVVRSAFTQWIARAPLPLDREIYMIGDEVAVDSFIRFESLDRDLEIICARLGVPWESARLGRFKSGYRTRTEPFGEYYTKDAAAVVRDLFAWELDYFNYSADPAAG